MPKRSRARSYVFTWNNYTEDDIKDLLQTFAGNDSSYLFQEEKGAEGTPHLQGMFKCKNPMDFHVIRVNWFKTKARVKDCKSWRGSLKYCCKQETRVGRVFHSDDIKVPKIAVDPIVDPKNWQKEAIAMINAIDDREIHWWVDRAGGRGKTSLCKHLVLKHDACYVAGKGADVKYLVSNWIKSRGYFPRLIVINYTRTLENFVNYGVIEEIKDGLFVSCKYKTEAVIMDCPQIFIFANFAPDMRKMTQDRWVIHDLDEQYESGGEEEEEEKRRPKRPRLSASASAGPAGAGARDPMQEEPQEEVRDELDEKHNADGMDRDW